MFCTRARLPVKGGLFGGLAEKKKRIRERNFGDAIVIVYAKEQYLFVCTLLLGKSFGFAVPFAGCHQLLYIFFINHELIEEKKARNCYFTYLSTFLLLFY